MKYSNTLTLQSLAEKKKYKNTLSLLKDNIIADLDDCESEINKNERLPIVVPSLLNITFKDGRIKIASMAPKLSFLQKLRLLYTLYRGL